MSKESSSSGKGGSMGAAPALKPFVFDPKAVRTAGREARRRVLYVEDEDANWDVAVLSLRDRYELDRARNSQEAFSRIKETTYDAILMDIQLCGSDLSGIEITRILRGQGAGATPSYAAGIPNVRVPIIFVTAYVERYSRADLLATGADEVITKPVKFLDLCLAITRAVSANTLKVCADRAAKHQGGPAHAADDVAAVIRPAPAGETRDERLRRG